MGLSSFRVQWKSLPGLPVMDFMTMSMPVLPRSSSPESSVRTTFASFSASLFLIASRAFETNSSGVMPARAAMYATPAFEAPASNSV